VTSPHVAPAADEILKSSGFKDATPNPSIAQLGGPPVQAEQIQAPQPMQGPQAGMQQGIETPEFD
jgi:hypothetical protein